MRPLVRYRVDHLKRQSTSLYSIPYLSNPQIVIALLFSCSMTCQNGELLSQERVVCRGQNPKCSEFDACIQIQRHGNEQCCIDLVLFLYIAFVEHRPQSLSKESNKGEFVLFFFLFKSWPTSLMHFREKEYCIKPPGERRPCIHTIG